MRAKVEVKSVPGKIRMSDMPLGSYAVDHNGVAYLRTEMAVVCLAYEGGTYPGDGKGDLSMLRAEVTPLPKGSIITITIE